MFLWLSILWFYRFMFYVCNLKEDVSDKKLFIMEKGKGKKRGLYRPRQRQDNGTKLVTSIIGSVTFRGEQYFKLASLS